MPENLPETKNGRIGWSPRRKGALIRWGVTGCATRHPGGLSGEQGNQPVQKKLPQAQAQDSEGFGQLILNRFR